MDTFDTQVSTSSKPSSTSQQPDDDIIWWESLLDGHAQRDQETDFSTRSSGDVLGQKKLQQRQREPQIV